jgi:ATP-dependent 26S proteasome regulatory subunit
MTETLVQNKADTTVAADLQYLKTELKRIDVLIRRAIRRWQEAGQNIADQFRGLYINDDEVASLVGRSFASNWGSEIHLSEEKEQEFAQEEVVLQRKARSLQQAHPGLRLVELARMFQLSEFEYNAFLICLAPALDLRYERLYGFLQDDVTRKNPSANLILDLLLPPGPGRLTYLDYFRDQSSLFSFGLLKKLDNESSHVYTLLRKEFFPAAEIVSWLLGQYRPADDLVNLMELTQPFAPTGPSYSFDEDISFDGELAVSQKCLMVFYGADFHRQTAAARRIAMALSRPLLEVHLEMAKEAGLSIQNVVRMALRDASLTGAIPFFSGWEIMVEDGALPGSVLKEIDWFQDLVIVSSPIPWRISGISGWDDRPVLWQQFNLPTNAQRLQLWRQNLGETGSIADADLELLAGQYVLSSTQIYDVVRTARNTALQNGRDLTMVDLFDVARQHSSHHLDTLAVKIKPRYYWEDVVLPEDELSILKEITTMVRERTQVLEKWGLEKKLVASAGISALFAGPPGTGKTLSAQVIAAELGMDLYKIDLSTVVSKYIGETEKNLERIFTQARNSNTILFFDEADAIFGKRSEVKDAHDRYANIEVGYLLQRMESYDGVVILSTNLRSNLDEAFTRRLQFVVDFPFPDEAQRLNIWKVLFPPGVPRDPGIDFAALAKKFKLPGGSIRNIIVNAAFMAASEKTAVSTRHILHGIRREMQKMGRLIQESDLVEV